MRLDFRRSPLTRMVAASLLIGISTLAASISPAGAFNDAPVPSVNTEAAFTPGNLVVYRVGTGAAALTNVANEVFLDEYTTTGTLVQSIAVPTVSSGNNKPLTASGTATSEGQITRSIDGKYIILTGYAAAPGTTGVASTASATVPRVIGRADAAGGIDTSTAITDAFSGNNVRSATSVDGSQFWTVGGNSGVRYTTLGSSASSDVSTTVANLRVVQIFGGQLYVSTGSGSAVRIGMVGTGTPNTSGQTITTLPGVPTTGSPYAFVLLDRNDGVPGLDSLYVAAESAGILKYSFDGAVWTSQGSIVAAGSLYGLTGAVGGNGVVLYGTGSTQGGGSAIVTLTDTAPYNSTITGTAALVTTAATNTAFRGIVFAPQGVVTPTSTATPTATATATATSTDTATATVTASYTTTATYTATSTASFTPSSTFTPTPSATFTSTGSATATSTATFTASSTFTPSATLTATSTGSATATNTATFTASSTFTPSATSTATSTSSATATVTNTPTPSRTFTASATSTSSSTPTRTSSSTPSLTSTPTSSPTVTATSTTAVVIRPDTPGLYNPANAFFLLRNFNSAGLPTYSFPYGPIDPNFVPLTGDWNGDGIDTVGLYNRATSVWLLSDNNVSVTYGFPYGTAGSGLLPFVGDWDNNGTDTPGLFNPASGAWLLINVNASAPVAISFIYGAGTPGLIPIPGDWDGDGDDTPGVWNPATGAWILSNALNTAPFTSFVYGDSSLKPVKGDYDANGTDTAGLWNPANGVWLLINVNASVAPSLTYVYGAGTPTLIPLMGKWTPGGAGGASGLYRLTPTPSFEATATAAPQVAPTFAARRDSRLQK